MTKLDQLMQECGVKPKAFMVFGVLCTTLEQARRLYPLHAPMSLYTRADVEKLLEAFGVVVSNSVLNKYVDSLTK